MGNLFLIFMHPLTAYNYCYSIFFIVIRNTRFRLEVSVFLDRRMIIFFHDHSRFGKTLFYISLADLEVTKFIGFTVWMNQDRISFQGFVNVSYDRQIFVCDFDLFSGYSCNLIRFSNDQSDIIPFKTDVVCKWLARTRPTQNRLIHRAETIFVYWNVFGSQDQNNTRKLQSFLNIDLFNDCMCFSGEQHFHVKLIRQIEISRV